MSPRAVVAAALVAILLTVPGCLTWRGSRLYQSVTAALDGGDARRAVSDLEEAALLVPDSSEIHNHLGLAYAMLGREDEALAAFQSAVELDCDNAAAQENLRAAQRRDRSAQGAAP